ncbi:MAG: endonuclease domain-containing protein [Gallionella sp.]|nr:endonuclease domain-containing protein [Gallionella sp.]MDD4945688.1 endonuclease domain-containing protein [Gallionella sp.]
MAQRDLKATTPPLRGTPPAEGNKRAPNSPPLEGWQAKPDGVVSRYTKNYQSLPFNPQLKEKAQALRRAGNLSEVLLWNQLKNKQFHGLDFDRQKIIGNYIVDFYCAEKQVVIEVDGSSHDDKAEYDAQRDAFLIGLDLEVIHIGDSDVKSNLSGVMDFLLNHSALATTPPLRGTPPLEGN